MKGFVDLEIRFKLCLRLGCSHWRAWLSHLLPLQFHVDFLIPLGFLMLLPYGLGTRVGQALFDPAREEGYRVVAYGIIATAIVLGLPVWG